MKKFKLLIPAVLAAIFTVMFAGCAKVPATEENTLTVADVQCYLNGDPVAINPVFSGKTEAISYTYDEEGIEILSGKVKGLREGEYEVTATSKSCEAKFTVSCVLPLKVADLYAWIDYPPSDISPEINVSGNKTVTYEYDDEMISIEGNYVTALKEGNTEVTAKIDGFETAFNVTCRSVNPNDSLYYMRDGGWNWQGKAISGRAKYNKEGTDGKTTVFIGDSFFDTQFFTAFNSFYKDKDALCLGIGGTTSQTWEMFLDSRFGYDAVYEGIQPKNAVVQLGNNNIYNDGTSFEETVENLQRYFTFMHGKMPNTKIYYFGVTPRTMSMTAMEKLTRRINAEMGKFCATKDWIVYLDTGDEMTPDKLADNIHPKPEHYDIFVNALEKAGIEIEDKDF